MFVCLAGYMCAYWVVANLFSDGLQVEWILVMRLVFCFGAVFFTSSWVEMFRLCGRVGMGCLDCLVCIARL